MAPRVTLQLAEYALSDAARLPPAVRNQARRAFLNHVGCTLGGATEPAVVHALALADEFSGARHASVLGQATRLDAPGAALVNALAASIHTFDDTHLASVTHPAGPVAAAAVALLQHRAAMDVPRRATPDGAEFLAALAFGIEIACRVAATLTAPPAQPALGLFTTGLIGGIGAAAACGRLLQLDGERMAWAIGLAAAQGCGFRATHATMAGGLVPALGARNGLAAALLAAKGFDNNLQALEGRNGFFEVFAPGADVPATVHGLGERFEMLELSYKPYPCGVVIHPAIDACLDLAGELCGQHVEAVVLQVHPLTLQLTGTRHPANAFGTKNSVHHWSAAALLRGRAGLAEATDAALNDPAIAALRDRIEAHADASLARDEVHAEVRLADGRVLRRHVPHARGSRERPLSDADLATKFMGMAQARLPGGQAASLLMLCETLPAQDAGWLAALTEVATPPLTV